MAETKTAGKDTSKTQQTTEQAKVAEQQVPTKVEERGDSDPKGAASGSVVGGVVDGDIGAKDEAQDEVKAFESGNVEGALGTVPERDLEGNEVEAPYTLLTADNALVRTSDSDDPAKDWTAQHAGGEREDEDGNSLDPVALTEVQGTPGQTFRARELPNREVAEAAGINYEQWVSTLPVRADVPNEAPRRGIPA